MKEIKASSKRLTGEQKCFVITHLGCFETLGEVQDLLRDTFGVHISAQAIHKIGKRYKRTIDKLKYRFQENIQASPIAIKGYRLKQLQHMFNSTKNIRLQIKILGVARQEMAAIEKFDNFFHNKTNKIKSFHSLQNSENYLSEEDSKQRDEDIQAVLETITHKTEYPSK